MADYTITNVRALEDMAPRFGLAPDLEARLTARELGLAQSGRSLQCLAPNELLVFGAPAVDLPGDDIEYEPGWWRE
jgi:hypothetical protein